MAWKHKVLDHDEAAGTLTCAHCGTVRAKIRGGRPKCSVAIREQSGRPDRPSRQKKRVRERTPEYVLYAAARRRAREKGLEFDLTTEDIVIPTHCPILGIRIVRGIVGPLDTSPSVDRIDNSGGYTRDNIQVLSYRANRLKSDATKEELLAIAATL